MTKKDSFQQECVDWAMQTFDVAHVQNTYVRACRFGEEALELVQALGVTKEDALKLVDYVYGRPVGEPSQEVGGVMVTMAVLCFAADLKMDECAERELARCWKNIEKIRAKQAQKPSFLRDPLPGVVVEVPGPGKIHQSNCAVLAGHPCNCDGYPTIDKAETSAMGLCECKGEADLHLHGIPGCIHHENGYSEKV